jgi:hypothetical protein
MIGYRVAQPVLGEENPGTLREERQGRQKRGRQSLAMSLSDDDYKLDLMVMECKSKEDMT